MEWVESTGKTIEEAKDVALDRLGVHEDDAEFKIVADVKTGLFGRVKEEARVRARVRPTTPRSKDEGRRPVPITFRPLQWPNTSTCSLAAAITMRRVISSLGIDSFECTDATTRSSSANTCSGRSRLPSSRMSTSMPDRTRNGATRSFTVAISARCASSRS